MAHAKEMAKRPATDAMDSAAKFVTFVMPVEWCPAPIVTAQDFAAAPMETKLSALIAVDSAKSSAAPARREGRLIAVNVMAQELSDAIVAGEILITLS